MEKRKAHYNLNYIKALIKEGKYQITKVAAKNARTDFSVFSDEIPQIILELKATELYKSMTCNFDSKIWQDVYHKQIFAKIAYIKIQIVEENTVIIQFKEKYR